jgi:alkylation response protein AidB-like acyl-CoA dehydrogenase
MRSKLVDRLVVGAQPPRSDLRSVWDGYQKAFEGGSNPFGAALEVASSVDRLGLAFAVGYSAALQTLVPEVVLPCALCVTETGGNHPRAIKTTLRASQRDSSHVLNGTKTFVTFGTLAKTLIIAARVGDQADGKPELVVVRIPADRDGVSLRELPPIPFVPEIPHARVELDDVCVDASERMSGDGYLEYVKPFRTVEDIHVYASAVAYLIGLGKRTGAPAGLLAEMVSMLVTLESLREAAPLDPNTHVAIHGVSEHLARLFASHAFAGMWDAASAEERGRWERDRKLLEVAQSARDARFQKAAVRLGLC